MLLTPDSPGMETTERKQRKDEEEEKRESKIYEDTSHAIRDSHREIRERVNGKGVMRRLFGSGCLTFYFVAKCFFLCQRFLLLSVRE